MKMKLSSFKRYRLAGIVICMLAAGICYSCGSSGGFGPQDESVMTLESAEPLGRDIARAADQEMSEAAGQEPAASEVPLSGRFGESGGDKPEKTALPPVFVHVCGQVEKPGVYELPAGSRVYEAVIAAGGFSGEAAGDYLNLAQEVQDGMKLEVPHRDQADEWKSRGQSGIALPGGQSFGRRRRKS